MMKTYRVVVGCVIASVCLMSGSAWAGKKIVEFPIPPGFVEPIEITSGPDGNLWFTLALNGGGIGRITIKGVITQFPVPTFNSEPFAITAGPDGALWFTESMTNKIGRITTAGVVTEFPIPTAATLGPEGITAGPDGNLWFTKRDPAGIGRITPAGAITEFGGVTAGSGPVAITAVLTARCGSPKSTAIE